MHSITKAIIAGSTGALVALGAVFGGSAITAPSRTTVQENTNTMANLGLPGDQVVVSGGCIRFTDTGPEWHVNGRHTTVGFDTSVPPHVNSDGDLEIPMEQTLDVISLNVNVDETLAVKGVWAGGSGGVGHVKIRLRKNGSSDKVDLNNPSDYSQIRGEYSNLWISVFSVAGTEAG